MSPDSLLGRSFLFRMNADCAVQLRIVTLIGLCPRRGVRLAGDGFAPAWIDRATWRRLLRTGVLEAA